MRVMRRRTRALANEPFRIASNQAVPAFEQGGFLGRLLVKSRSPKRRHDIMLRRNHTAEFCVLSLGKNLWDWPVTCYWEVGIADVMGWTGPRLMRTRVIAMPQHDDTRKKQAATVTNAKLSKAIEQHSVPFRREGDEYVLRQADVRKLAARRDGRPEIAPKRDTLEMSRPA